MGKSIYRFQNMILNYLIDQLQIYLKLFFWAIRFILTLKSYGVHFSLTFWYGENQKEILCLNFKTPFGGNMRGNEYAQIQEYNNVRSFINSGVANKR